MQIERARMERIRSLPQTRKRFFYHTLARYGVWLLAGSIGLLILVGFSLGLIALVQSDGEMNPFTHLFFLPFSTVVYGLIGLLITRRYVRNPVGWILLIVGLFSAVTLLSAAYTQFAHFTRPDSVATVLEVFIWLDRWVWVVPSAMPLTLALLYFPDGYLLSARWRWAVWLACLSMVGLMIGAAFYPTSLPDFGLTEHNPYGIPGTEGLFLVMLNIAGTGMMISLLGSVVSVIVRYRRSSGAQRNQIKWLLYVVGLIATVLLMLALVRLIIPVDTLMVELGIMINSGGVTLIIATIGFAILRQNLWDVEPFINRTVVYGLLTLIVIGMYILLVSFMTGLFDENNLLFSLVATGVVAVSFQPLKEVVQTQVSRLLFGQRDNPYHVLQQLSAQLEPITAMQDLLPMLVANISLTLRLPYVAVMLRYDGRDYLVAAYPSDRQTPDNITYFALVYQTQVIGQLLLSPRSHDETFTRSEQALFRTIARQVSIAAYNVHLTEDLQRSRQEIVTAREEERRRLRRDLHDGLGPVLAAMSFRLDAVRNFIARDPAQAQQLTGELQEQVQSVLSEIRRIAYNLRPPALDELGLPGALRQHIESTHQADGLHYSLDLPLDLPPLPAAVEVAAYRIVIEAFTNVQRHANAASCIVRVHPDEHGLCIIIEDDGSGIAPGEPFGVGLNAMRERATELGGQFSVGQSVTGGTHIQVWLPFYEDRKA